MKSICDSSNKIRNLNILVLNCGSSSLKFQLIQTDLDAITNETDRRVAYGQVERIGGAAVITFTADGHPPFRSAMPIKTIRTALDKAVEWLVSDVSKIQSIQRLADIDGVGHRVVHGGEHFSESVLITDDVLRGIEDCIDLAPLHNPANLAGIRAVKEIFGAELPQAAVFDTAFHQTLPEHAYLYAVPYQMYRRHRIRRYGFHGTSHRYVAHRYRLLRSISRDAVNVITLHLGNGCSIAAIKNGASVDTSMGLTPLEGLVMGTRSGDLDPAIVEFIASKEGMTVHEVETMLNTQSGLLGISGMTNDMRELLAESLENADRRAALAIELFCYRARKYVGCYLAAMNGADAIIFTGGIGENSPRIRDLICSDLSFLGITLDGAANEEHYDGKEGVISTTDSSVGVYVVPTNEELLIARDTACLVSGDAVTAAGR